MQVSKSCGCVKKCNACIFQGIGGNNADTPMGFQRSLLDMQLVSTQTLKRTNDLQAGECFGKRFFHHFPAGQHFSHHHRFALGVNSFERQ
nr:hypothetical protein [uncultured bacterium]